MSFPKILALSLVLFAFSCRPQAHNPGPDAEDELEYKIGDYYEKGLAKGLVISVDEDGQHGLLVSLDEKNLQWSSLNSSIIVGAVYVSMDDGSVNAEGIKSLFENWNSDFPAMAWCASKNPGALNSWYLPAASEIRAILDTAAALPLVNESLQARGGSPLTPGSLYWSSTDAGAQLAYSYFYRADMSADEEIYHLSKKDSSLNCRCVRRF